ncbi:lpd-7 [Pristionchus pacificus]|uniref:Pescadillo homolog n=1 Tax=Pristionchus pacificus TaxID=54126 RepID=A0A2A6CHL4_PRIPA|nr:lpd-7 [Pristionchus pacificus]|eukprot:PDM77511.1 lpd-7 [Pristionchus pacificus]
MVDDRLQSQHFSLLEKFFRRNSLLLYPFHQTNTSKKGTQCDLINCRLVQFLDRDLLASDGGLLRHVDTVEELADILVLDGGRLLDAGSGLRDELDVVSVNDDLVLLGSGHDCGDTIGEGHTTDDFLSEEKQTDHLRTRSWFFPTRSISISPMVNQKRKGEQGAAVNFVSRKKALIKLQLSLNDFRRLCILKGVYPHEPNNRKKVQNGSSERKILYLLKDIKFLAQEPIINQFRNYKVFLRKLNHAKAKREAEKYTKIIDNKPQYQLDRIVKERYPTFSSAIRELDDALCLCFVFARFPRTKQLDTNLINECQRLTAEFMHYCIEARAVTNTFVSIKGIYYQAEILGEKITWLVAHDRGLPVVKQVDWAVLSTFAEFYVAMLSFVMFRLYQSVGLVYPPSIVSGEQTVTVEGGEDEDDEEIKEKIYSLAKPLLKKTGVEIDNDDNMDNFDAVEAEEELQRKLNEKKALKVLFSGSTFWLNRETPKESLAFLIRSCGGKVGWDGAPVDIKEDADSITYQIVDRPMKSTNIGRIYVQPQFVYDCVNARRRLPTSLYAPGASLPPHLSPFHAERAGDYVPVERLEELRAQGKDVTNYVTVDHVVSEEKKQKKPKVVKKKAEGLAVTPGQMHKVNQQRIINLQGEANKMRELMIPKKQQRLYQKLKKGLKRTRTEGAALAKKRARLDEAKAAAMEQ